MVKQNVPTRRALTLLFLLMTACAGRPVGQAFLIPPGITASASTYAVSPPASEAERAALPIVEQQLQRLGYRQSPSPDLIVKVAVSERGRDIGAYSTGACDPSNWLQKPGRKWFAGGGRVLGLQLILLDAQTRLPVYRSSASMRTSGGWTESDVEKLAATALRDDPRRARSCPAAS